jgi:hypothetical protein
MLAEMKVGQFSEAIDFDQCDLAYSVAVIAAILKKEVQTTNSRPK